MKALIFLLIGSQALAAGWVKAPGGVLPDNIPFIYSKDCGVDCFPINVDPDVAVLANGIIVADPVKVAAKQAILDAKVADKNTRQTKRANRVIALKACSQAASLTAAQIENCLQVLVKEVLQGELSTSEQ